MNEKNAKSSANRQEKEELVRTQKVYPKTLQMNEENAKTGACCRENEELMRTWKVYSKTPTPLQRVYKIAASMVKYIKSRFQIVQFVPLGVDKL